MGGRDLKALYTPNVGRFFDTNSYVGNADPGAILVHVTCGRPQAIKIGHGWLIACALFRWKKLLKARYPSRLRLPGGFSQGR